MVYPLTYTHLDIEATCLLLIKATLGEYPSELVNLCFDVEM